MKKVLILGETLSGIMAKCLLPEAILLEEKTQSSISSELKRGIFLRKKIPEFKTTKVKVTSVFGRHDFRSSGRYLIKEMPDVKSIYGVRLVGIDLKNKLAYFKMKSSTLDQEGTFKIRYDTLISTIPLPDLLVACNIMKCKTARIEFKFSPIYIEESEFPFTRKKEI